MKKPKIISEQQLGLFQTLLYFTVIAYRKDIEAFTTEFQQSNIGCVPNLYLRLLYFSLCNFLRFCCIMRKISVARRRRNLSSTLGGSSLQTDEAFLLLLKTGELHIHVRSKRDITKNEKF